MKLIMVRLSSGIPAESKRRASALEGVIDRATDLIVGAEERFPEVGIEISRVMRIEGPGDTVEHMYLSIPVEHQKQTGGNKAESLFPLF